MPESAHILPIDACPVLSPCLARAFGQLQEMARSNSLAPGILEVEAFVDSEDAETGLEYRVRKISEASKEFGGRV